MYFTLSADPIYMQDPYLAITLLFIKFPWLENRHVYNVIVSTDELTQLGPQTSLDTFICDFNLVCDVDIPDMSGSELQQLSITACQGMT